jgi:hypothetical protein
LHGPKRRSRVREGRKGTLNQASRSRYATTGGHS